MSEHPLEEIYRWLSGKGTGKFNDTISGILRYELPPGVMVKRVIMIDGSFLDIYWSPSKRYSLHYERHHIDGKLYHHDNAPQETQTYKNIP